jgi:hypothetical protein
MLNGGIILDYKCTVSQSVTLLGIYSAMPTIQKSITLDLNASELREQ